MTQQLARGARQALNRIEDEIEDAREAAHLADTHSHDPAYIRDRMSEIFDALARLERKLEREIEPLLARREPTVEQRLAEIEERVASLEAARALLR